MTLKGLVSLTKELTLSSGKMGSLLKRFKWGSEKISKFIWAVERGRDLKGTALARPKL